MSQPVLPQQRINYLDVLRGFAITGVLVAYVFWNLGTAPYASFSAVDRALDQVLAFLVDSKCFALLANLFMVGFVLHMNKASHSGSMYTYRRRLLGLMIIGVGHAVLLRNGDILVPYALMAFLVTFFYRASTTVIILMMLLAFIFQSTAPELYHWLHIPIPVRPAATGNYWMENLRWVRYWYAAAPLVWETTLIFLFSGMLLGRFFIEDKQRLSPLTLWIMIAGGSALGVLSYFILSYTRFIDSLPGVAHTALIRRTVTNLIWMIHRSSLAVTYAALFYQWSRRRALRWLAVLGRMSLTNYILQAVIIVPVCLVFHLFDRMTPTQALVMVLVVLVFQVMFSNWWLKHYRFGPLEWLLRWFTYGRSLPGQLAAPGPGVAL